MGSAEDPSGFSYLLLNKDLEAREENVPLIQEGNPKLLHTESRPGVARRSGFLFINISQI